MYILYHFHQVNVIYVRLKVSLGQVKKNMFFKHKRAAQSHYLLIYSWPNVEKFPSQQSFGKMLQSELISG